MTTHKPKDGPLNSVFMACKAHCLLKDVYVIIFGTLAVFGFKTTEKVLDY